MNGYGSFLFLLEAVDADYDRFLAIHRLLKVVGSVLNFLLDISQFNGLQRAPHGIDLFQVNPGPLFDFIGKGLDVVRPGKRINSIRSASLVGDDLLGTQGDANGFLGWQAQGFIE